MPSSAAPYVLQGCTPLWSQVTCHVNYHPEKEARMRSISQFYLNGRREVTHYGMHCAMHHAMHYVMHHAMHPSLRHVMRHVMHCRLHWNAPCNASRLNSGSST